MKYRVLSYSLLLLLILNSCNNNSGSTENPAVVAKDTTVTSLSPLDAVPQKRDKVKEEAVASFKVTTGNPLNDWYFKVEMYETPTTFHYLLKMQYEEIRGTDTLKLPNFGIWPEPVIKKGNEPFSCIIGFMDKDKKFREYKKVYVKNNVLKVTTLKHYTVYAWKKEVVEK